MPTKSIISRLVYLTAASAAAKTGISRSKLAAELEPAAWYYGSSLAKKYPLYSPEDVARYAEQVAAAKIRREHPTRVSIPVGAGVSA